jgi:hypothetical protein
MKLNHDKKQQALVTAIWIILSTYMVLNNRIILVISSSLLCYLELLVQKNTPFRRIRVVVKIKS